MRIASVGHAVFAAVLIAIGIAGLLEAKVRRDMAAGTPRNACARGLDLPCASISLAVGCGLLWPRTAARASRVLLAYLLLWLLIFRVPALFLAPGQQDSWSGCGETMVIVAGAWVLYAWFATDWDRASSGFASGNQGSRTWRG